MNGDAANFSSVTTVVSLDLVVNVVKDNDGRYEEDNLPSWKQVQIVAAILSTVAVSVVVQERKKKQLPIDGLLIEQIGDKK